MTMTKEYIESKLEEIHASKKGKIIPDYVLEEELNRSVIKDVKKTLNEMYLDHEIRVGETLNSKYIEMYRWKE